MPNIKSAIRKVKRVKKQTIVNKSRKNRYKEALKKMQKLIEKKDSINLNSQNNEGATPLLAAVASENDRMVEYLVQLKDVNNSIDKFITIIKKNWTKEQNRLLNKIVKEFKAIKKNKYMGNNGFVVKIYYNPLVIWIWIGAIVIFLGGITTLSINFKKVGILSR